MRVAFELLEVLVGNRLALAERAEMVAPQFDFLRLVLQVFQPVGDRFAECREAGGGPLAEDRRDQS